MANSIELFKNYIDRLPEVFRRSSLTSVLDGDAYLTREGANANEIVIPKYSVQGLGDYSRTTGMTDGDISVTTQTVTFDYDRARRFGVDAMDNEETAGIAFGSLSKRLIETKVVPEVDAFRFAKYASLAGSVGTPTTYTDPTDLLEDLSAAAAQMDEQETPYEGRYLFITPTLSHMAASATLDTNKYILDTFTQIITVPQTRFYTDIELLSGGTGEEAGGYIKNATEGKDINFMIINREAIIQYRKHLLNQAFSPEENQGNKDGWIFKYREYGLADVYDERADWIYLNHKN